MTKPKLLSNEEYVRLLEAQEYDDILLSCQDYIRDKVDNNLRNFHYYHQYKDDFYHEVCIHILTKSLPSPAFLKACQNGNTFIFYLAKSIRNILNTLLNKERIKREKVMALEHVHNSQEDQFDIEKSSWLSDKSQKEQTESQDLLRRIKERFEMFLKEMVEALPKVAYKLIFLLKIQARAPLYKADVKACFPSISEEDAKRLLEALGEDESYRHREDREIFAIVHPFFRVYRKEKGSPSALQRWVNQHISGDKYSKGILDRVEIRDLQNTYRIVDKKIFADFLHLYFTEQAVPVEIDDSPALPVSENALSWNELKPRWQTIVGS